MKTVASLRKIKLSWPASHGASFTLWHDSDANVHLLVLAYHADSLWGMRAKCAPKPSFDHDSIQVTIVCCKVRYPIGIPSK